jgi:hypothetical protein
LGKLTNDIGKKISAESAQQLANQPEKVLSSPMVIAEIEGVINNRPVRKFTALTVTGVESILNTTHSSQT